MIRALGIIFAVWFAGYVAMLSILPDWVCKNPNSRSCMAGIIVASVVWPYTLVNLPSQKGGTTTVLKGNKQEIILITRQEQSC